MTGRTHIMPGNIVLHGGSGVYRWDIHPSGDDSRDPAQRDPDINGNGRANLIMSHHVGGNTDGFLVYELIDGVAVPILKATGSPGRIEGPDSAGMYHFIGDLERQSYETRRVKLPLTAGAEPIEIDLSPGGG